jgi:hypothetical protein
VTNNSNIPTNSILYANEYEAGENHRSKDNVQFYLFVVSIVEYIEIYGYEENSRSVSPHNPTLAEFYAKGATNNFLVLE